MKHGKDTTKTQVISRSAQADRILADFKGNARPTERPVTKAKGGPVSCGCGGSGRK